MVWFARGYTKKRLVMFNYDENILMVSVSSSGQNVKTDIYRDIEGLIGLISLNRCEYWRHHKAKMGET